MAITVVTHVSAGNNNAGVTSSAVDDTGANLIVFGTSSDSATVSDSKSNTWTARSSGAGTGPVLKVYDALGATVGSGHTFTATTGFPGIAVVSLAGVLASGAFDQFAQATGSTVTSLAPGSITPAVTGEGLVLFLAVDTLVTGVTPPAGFTLQESKVFAAGASYGIYLATQIYTTTTPLNPSWSWTTPAVHCVATVLSYKPAASASTIVQRRSLLGTRGGSRQAY